MTKGGLGALTNVVLDADPAIPLIPNFFAVHAGGQDSFETLDAILQVDDAFCDYQPGP